MPLYIYPANHEQEENLIVFLNDQKVPYEIETVMDETKYLLSTEANKKALYESMVQVKEGKVVPITLDEIWKQ